MGISGSGKTTVAAHIAARLSISHIELDAIHWQPNWEMLELGEFRRRVQELVAVDAWVVDGNYSKVRDLVLPRADTLLFLDLPLWRSIWRLLQRTIRRTIRREPLWGGNRENLKTAFFSSDSVLIYALRTYRRRQLDVQRIKSDPRFAHLHIEHLRSKREVEDWIQALGYRK